MKLHMRKIIRNDLYERTIKMRNVNIIKHVKKLNENIIKTHNKIRDENIIKTHNNNQTQKENQHEIKF